MIFIYILVYIYIYYTGVSFSSRFSSPVFRTGDVFGGFGQGILEFISPILGARSCEGRDLHWCQSGRSISPPPSWTSLAKSWYPKVTDELWSFWGGYWLNFKNLTSSCISSFFPRKTTPSLANPWAFRQIWPSLGKNSHAANPQSQIIISAEWWIWRTNHHFWLWPSTVILKRKNA